MKELILTHEDYTKGRTYIIEMEQNAIYIHTVCKETDDLDLILETTISELNYTYQVNFTNSTFKEAIEKCDYDTVNTIIKCLESGVNDYNFNELRLNIHKLQASIYEEHFNSVIIAEHQQLKICYEEKGDLFLLMLRQEGYKDVNIAFTSNFLPQLFATTPIAPIKFENDIFDFFEERQKYLVAKIFDYVYEAGHTINDCPMVQMTIKEYELEKLNLLGNE